MDSMDSGQKTAKIIEGISAEMLAVDPGDRETVAQIGAAVDVAMEEMAETPAVVRAALALVSKSLRLVCQESVPNGPELMDVTVAVLMAAAEYLSEGAECGNSAELDGAVAILSEALAAGNSAPAGGGEERAAQPAQSSGGGPVVATHTLPEDADLELLKEFVVESKENISGAEAALLALEHSPGDAEQINTIFRAFHTIKGTSGFFGLDLIHSLAHQAENLLDRAREGKIRIVGGYADLALNSCDVLRVMVEGLDGVEPGAPLLVPESYTALLNQLSDPERAGIGEEAEVPDMRTGDILVGRGRVAREELEESAADQGGVPIGQKLVLDKVASVRDVVDALRTQQKMRGRAEGDGTIRVATGRLDSLSDMVGELVIAQSMVAQDTSSISTDNQQLARSVSRAGKIIREIQDLATSLRMVPLKGTFGKMARLVRDLARKAGKEIQFVTDGDETDIDRNVVEVLNDPLVHMMRNAVDHGIETAEQRSAAGKPAAATVSLRAYHSGGNVVIELTDDGKGLDREKIVAKAIDRGLIKPGENLTDSEAFAFIFHPGFSTADKVTDVSGRGVGMDVVKRNIESIRGRVDMSSKQGEGSTFTIRVPLTMAIADAMLVRVGDERYLIPIVVIERSLRPDPDTLSTVLDRGEMVMIHGSLLPVFRLHRMFKIKNAVTDPCKSILIVIQNNDQRCALMADELLGQHQVVIKPISDALGKVPGVSGAAILGDGRVGLILDAAGLMSLADESHTADSPNEPQGVGTPALVAEG